MKMNNLPIVFYLLFTFCLFSNSTFSQKKEINKDDLVYGTLLDWVGKQINEPTPTIFKTEPYDESIEMRKCTNSKEALLAAVNFMRENHFVSVVEQFGKKNLKCVLSFPDNFKENSRNYKVELIEHNLTNESEKMINLKLDGFPANKSGFKSERINGKMVSKNLLSTGVYNEIENYEDWTKATAGELVYEIKFRTGYDVVAIKLTDVGRTFEINGVTFNVVAIYDNKIALKQLGDDPQPITFKSINLDASEKNHFTPYSYSALLKLAKEDEKYADASSTSMRILSANPKLFDFFRENPNADIELLKSTFSKENLAEFKNMKDYHLVILSAPITHKVLLYQETPGIKERIKINY